MNFSNITLGELLSSTDPTIKRHAFGLLKALQKERDTQRKKDKEAWDSTLCVHGIKNKNVCNDCIPF